MNVLRGDLMKHAFKCNTNEWLTATLSVITIARHDTRGNHSAEERCGCLAGDSQALTFGSCGPLTALLSFAITL